VKIYRNTRTPIDKQGLCRHQVGIFLVVSGEG
jgi:hypothetical protein